jgi:outer membrane protein TolC
MKRTFLRSVSWNQRGALLLAGVFLLAIPLAGVPAQAATAVRVGTNLQPPPPAEPPAFDIRNNAIQLSIDRAIEIALQRNLGIVVQRYARIQSLLAFTQSLGIYDLQAQATADASNENAAVTDQTQAAQQKGEDLGFTFVQRVPTGGNVTLGWQNSYLSSNAGTRLTPSSYGSGLNFSFVQPLLGGYGQLVNDRNILIAQTNSQLSRQDFQLQVTTIAQQVVNAYWNLVNAREQLGVAQESLQLARDLHARNKIQVEVGTLPPLDLTQSEAAIATREEGIIQATSAVGDAEDTLRQLLNLPPGPLWATPIVPTSDPKTDEKVAVNLDEALRIALAQRPELRQQELQLAQAKRDADFFRNLIRPSLGLTVRYGYNGTGTAYNDAFSEITGLEFRTWSAALQFAYPIQNRAARAQSASANIGVDRFQALYDQERTVVETEVRHAARAVDTAIKSIDAAIKAREFQEKNLDAEKKRYENGMSTSFQITQIQDQLTQARSQEVTATVNYRTALAEYYRSIGRLLDQEGVTLDDPQTPDYASQRYSFRRGLLPGERR